MKFYEIKEDLFNTPSTYALVHCISKDCGMGAGIAVQFNKKFKLKMPLLARNPQVGQAVMYQTDSRTVFNLITKQNYWHKPTYATLLKTLEDMREQVVKHDIKQIAMPKIGCGLDKLEWHMVRKLIEDVFRDVDVEIKICYL